MATSAISFSSMLSQNSSPFSPVRRRPAPADGWRGSGHCHDRPGRLRPPGPRPVSGEVADDRTFLVAHHRPHRDGHFDVLAPGPVALLARGRACHRWRPGRDGPGTRAARTRWSSRSAKRRRRDPRRRRRGPPLSTCASRRHDTAPAPPFPARAWSCAWSTKPDMARKLKSRRAGGRAGPTSARKAPARCQSACTARPPPPDRRPPTHRSPGSRRRPTPGGPAARPD